MEPYPPHDRRGDVDRKVWLAVIVAAVVLAALTWQQWRHQGDREAELAAQLDSGWVAPTRVIPSGSLESAEQVATEFEPETDSHGSYFFAAQSLVREFGAELLWSDAAESACGHGGASEYSIAYYCPRDPYIVWLNKSSNHYPDLLYREDFIAFVKHELAHHIIDTRCNTPRPRLAGDLTEGVTNSYAVSFLGADAGALARAARGFPEYAMSDDTQDVAAQVHAGTCG